MNDMMNGFMGGHWLMGALAILVVVVLLLAAVALIKYLIQSGANTKDRDR